jgi:hypothetical protein
MHPTSTLNPDQIRHLIASSPSQSPRRSVIVLDSCPMSAASMVEEMPRSIIREAKA